MDPEPENVAEEFPQLFVRLPPFPGAIRSSSFSMRNRFFGAGVADSAGGGCSGLGSFFGSMVELLETGWETGAASVKQRWPVHLDVSPQKMEAGGGGLLLALLFPPQLFVPLPPFL